MSSSSRSPFRSGFLKVALFIGGAWVDVPSTEIRDTGVSIIRGRQNETGSSEPSRVTLSLKDPTGKWNPRHPSSVYYGLIGRGTPMRVQVEMTAGVVVDRWYGEVVTWEPRWTATGSKDARVDIEGAGTLRRLGQGAAPLRSPLYRALSTTGSNLVGYWPMEDEDGATRYTAYVGTPMSIKGTTYQTAGYSSFPSSEPIPLIGDALLTAVTATHTAATSAQVRWIAHFPASTPDNTVLVRIYFTGGTLARVDVKYTAAGGSITVEGFDAGDTSLGWNAYAFGLDNTKFRMGVEFLTSGSNVNWTFATLQPGASFAFLGGGTWAGVTLGKVAKVVVNPNKAALTGLAFGHLTVEKAVTTLFTVSASTLAGYAGEAADSRISRLCTENGLTFSAFSGASAQSMGIQGTKELLDLLRECEVTDGGMLYEPKSTFDLGYRAGSSLYSQTGVTLPYVENMFQPFEPVEDDQALRNKVTVKREGGSEATVEITTGRLGTASVGIYDEQVTLSLSADPDATQQAGWRAHLGTHDEARWPQIGVDLSDPRILANTAKRDALLSADLGTRLMITGVPSWLPPFAVDQIVLGYTETITPLSYKIAFNCTPARPYRGAYWNSATDRYSGEGTVLAAAITTTSATTFTVTTPLGVAWTSADGSYDILINGEQMTVTNVTGNTFTVTRSVNGVSKAHAVGSAVDLADTCFYGL